MAFDGSFGVTEIYVGNTTNRIGIDSEGNMTLTDGAVPAITLSEIIELSSGITFDTLVDTEDSTVNKKYILKKVTDGWEVEEFTESTSDTIVVEVEVTDWVADATAIDGNPGYTVTIPHNLSLTLPADLLQIQLWNSTYEIETIHSVQQSTNSVTLVSENNSTLYVTMR